MELGGWYPDPDGTPGRVRWWDGSASSWTGHTARAGSAQARRPPQVDGPRNWWQRLRASRGRNAERAQPEPALVAQQDWRERPAAAGPDVIPYDDPASGIYNAPYDAPAPERAEPERAVPYEDPAAGIFAARLDEAGKSTKDRAPVDDVISYGSAPAADRWRGLLRNPAFGYSFMAVLVVAVVVVGLVLTGGAKSPQDDPVALPSQNSTPDNRPLLEQLCANTSPSNPDPHAPTTPVPPGNRIIDTNAHISYAQQGTPFRAWDLGPWGNVGGGLGEIFTTGQYFVTQADTPDHSPYMATVLSGTVPATYSDDPHPNIECAARVIGDDVRKSYYPQPNTRKDLTAKSMTISGRPAYLLEFHLAFDEPGFNAKGELVAICVIDVPGNKAAALYVSIPDTHQQYDKIVQPLVNSIRVN
jgi:hypothetical protein